jgi:hypothetical protein
MAGGEFKIAVNGEPVVTGSNGAFQDVTSETFDGGAQCCTATVDYRRMSGRQYPNEDGRVPVLRPGAVVAASSTAERMTSRVSCQSHRLVPGDEYELVIAPIPLG